MAAGEHCALEADPKKTFTRSERRSAKQPPPIAIITNQLTNHFFIRDPSGFPSDTSRTLGLKQARNQIPLIQ